MSDLRQGVTPTQHAVLDMIEAKGSKWGNLYDFETQLKKGWDRARMASRVSLLSKKRAFAIEAAAHLIDAADEIGRMIEIDGDC